jgi:hypothetical protein
MHRSALLAAAGLFVQTAHCSFAGIGLDSDLRFLAEAVQITRR